MSNIKRVFSQLIKIVNNNEISKKLEVDFLGCDRNTHIMIIGHMLLIEDI